MKGYQFALAGPIYAGHQRDPAQRDRRARARPPEEVAVRFAFTDEQLAFRDATRDLLAKECTPAHVRAAWTNDTGRVPGLWEQLAEMGVLGLLVPEARRRPRPVRSSTSCSCSRRRVATRCRSRSSRPRPYGAAAPRPLAERDRRRRAQSLGSPLGRHRQSVDLHRRGPLRARRGRRSSPRPSVDGARRLFEVHGTPARGSTSPAVARRLRPRRVRNRRAAMRVWRDRMLELTVDYVKERHQFGVPVGCSRP